MKKTFYIIFVFSLFHNFTNAQWVQQTSGVTTSLLDIDFINENTGWACGDNGVVLKTTNGGINWIQQNTGVLKRLEGIDAVDASTLYCVGWFQTIIKSTNGGANWNIIRDGPSGVGSTFFKTFFLNANTGWLLRSGGGYVLRTSNGGLTFDSTFTNNSFNRDIYFKDANTGVICGDGAWIIRSTDGGITWVQKPLPLFQFGAPNLYRISFVGNTGWSVGEGGTVNMGRLVYKTTDFGSTWDSIGRVPYPLNELNYSVFFPSLNTGYAGGTNGYTFKTTNGGLNWYTQLITGGGFRRDFNFVNDTVGWVTGGGGQVFKTTTGGQFVNIVNINSEIPSEHNIQNIFPNPFNPVTNIEFDLAYNDDVEIIIYDLLGRKVEVLLNGKLKAGRYKITFNGANLSTGIYICRLVTPKIQKSKTMVLIK